jgi:hypothetical protein
MIGGRSAWLAWPVGVACAGVVAALAYLAAPGIPTAVAFVGDLLRAGTSAPQAEATTAGANAAGKALSDDCRSLYPDGLWVEMSWTPHVILSQSTAAPATFAPTVADALSPRVRMTCDWRNDAGATVTTTLSSVDGAGSAIARAGLAAQGFSCEDSGDGVRCTRTKGGVVEDQVVRGGLWLVTVERGWTPDRYTDRLVQRLWP